MTQHTDLIDRLRCFDRVTCNEAATALEAQAREIAELKAQEAELCTLYGLAQAECQKLRKDAALVAARERERCEKAVENSSSCFTSDQAYIKKLAVAAIRALNTEGEGNDRP